jgi:hypothetical protein
MPLYEPGNMFFRGQWLFCATYDPGDVAARAGELWLAIRQSAGMDPADPASENYWKSLCRCGDCPDAPGTVYAARIYCHTLTAGDVAGRYFSLPPECPDAAMGLRQFSALFVGTDAQFPGADFDIIADGEGRFRRVSWAGMGLEDNPPMAEGWQATLIYHAAMKAAGGGGLESVTHDATMTGDGTPGSPLSVVPSGGGLASVEHDATLTGDGTAASPLSVVGGSGGSGGYPGGAPGEYLTRGANEGDGVWVPFPFDDAEMDMIRAYLTGRPAKPQNVSPEDGAVNVYRVPGFVGTRYESPVNCPMDKMRLQIATDADFSTVVFDEEFLQSETSVNPENFWAAIQPATQYWWRIWYQDADWRWSAPSEPSEFTTEAVFTTPVVVTPVIKYPREAALVPAQNPFVASSPFEVRGGVGVHVSSDWQAALDRAFTSVILDDQDDTANLTTKELALTLTANTYARVRHKEGNTGIKSPWSPGVMIRPRPLYTDELIGIGLRVGNAGNIAVHHIDEAGNDATVPADYFMHHPIYNFSMDNIAGQAMAGIIPVFVKCETNEAAGPGEDRHRIWIAPYQFAGSYLHPAFAVSTGKIWYGRARSSNVYGGSGGPTEASANSNANSGRDTFSTLSQPSLAAADWLNTGADTDHMGWFVESIYEYALKTLLLAIEYRTFNMSIIPVNHNSGRAYDSLLPLWHGVFNPVPLQSSYGVCLTGFSVNNYTNGGMHNAYARTTYPGDVRNTALQADIIPDTPVTIPSGYVTKIASGWSADLQCDLELLFVPKETSAAPGGLGASVAGLETGHVVFSNIVGLSGNNRFPMGISGAQTYTTFRLVKKF